MKTASLLVLFSFLALAQDAYKGPIPPKDDLPYLKHANNLVPMDVGEAKDESKKDDTIYAISGSAASARTPLTEPIFIFKMGSLDPDKFQLYKMDVKGGRRELVLPKKANKQSRPIRMSLDKVATAVYKLEVQEALENGEYCLSPSGSNAVFCFAVY